MHTPADLRKPLTQVDLDALRARNLERAEQIKAEMGSAYALHPENRVQRKLQPCRHQLRKLSTVLVNRKSNNESFHTDLSELVQGRATARATGSDPVAQLEAQVDVLCQCLQAVLQHTPAARQPVVDLLDDDLTVL